MSLFGCSFGHALVLLLAMGCVYVMILRAGRLFHKDMIKSVFAAPINLFYDVTPSGVILNRFSKDLMAVDDDLPRVTREIFAKFYDNLAILVVIANCNIYAIAAAPLICLMISHFYKVMIPAYRECQRIIQVCASPVITHASETNLGTSTIRAFGKNT